MKSLFGWILDPYVHVILIGLVLAWLSVGSSRDDARPERVLTYCEHCRDYHDGSATTCRLVAVVDGLLGRE